MDIPSSLSILIIIFAGFIKKRCNLYTLATPFFFSGNIALATILLFFFVFFVFFSFQPPSPLGHFLLSSHSHVVQNFCMAGMT